MNYLNFSPFPFTRLTSGKNLMKSLSVILSRANT